LSLPIDIDEIVVVSVVKSPSKDIELVVSVIGGVDVPVVVRGVLLDLVPRVPGTTESNLAAISTKLMLNSEC
jgi:hypothetical protein